MTANGIVSIKVYRTRVRLTLTHQQLRALHANLESIPPGFRDRAVTVRTRAIVATAARRLRAEDFDTHRTQT